MQILWIAPMEGTGNFNATKEETAVAIAVSKGNQELLNDLNEAIGQIPSEELEKMIEDSCQYQPLEKTEEDVSTLSFFEMVNLLVHNYGLIFVKGAGIALLLALWRRQAKMSPDLQWAIGSIPACRSTASGPLLNM